MANYSLFLATFKTNLSTALSSSCSAWSFSPTAGFKISFLCYDSQTPPHIYSLATKHLFILFQVIYKKGRPEERTPTKAKTNYKNKYISFFVGKKIIL